MTSGPQIDKGSTTTSFVFVHDVVSGQQVVSALDIGVTAIEFLKAALTNFGYSLSCRATLLCDGRSILANG